MKSRLALLLQLASAIAGAADNNFEARCEKLAAEAKFTAVFEDKPVRRDDGIRIADLARFTRSGSSVNHSTLGVTRAEPAASMVLSVRTLSNRDGRVCAVPSLQLKLGLSSFEVLLARELGPHPCRRRIVDEHEEEHVTVWRNHLRIGARLMPVGLRQALGQVAYFSSVSEAESVLRQRADQQLASLLSKLKDGINAAHQQIDSTASYRDAENRMRACP
ncbi:MAG: hypothetical protein KKE51_19920 [Gammaproteobacteria bacterium]|nr:hypothetical protein [Gammaproteobacteria bacterium]MBU1601255.1 hypothetical protein [Gammaproteobacteria bacterium]MBU2433836.1 hypothetical protein [Gammaproteobacteria bacterium]MBU2450646.1 hypothetical protein [Gammaproteobacteria bacterium]